ncbi:glucanase B [Emericellopsis atlantica]|uniref:Glucanase B n=1 Tax=Emericellopsis atlantica TaxID=2614577 RepID=A0A9P7ZT15_9HYPO|nr:glucanase B [Emericellopsis atlantica]KAG9257150.1 glucanase B [Emericellopsis atlantica]
MRSLVFLAGLLGSALAAPYTHMGSLRRSDVPKNDYTRIDMSLPDKVVVTRNNTLNSTEPTDHAFSIQAQQVPISQSLHLSLVNNIGGDGLVCYLSAADSDGRVFFLKEDGSLYYPSAGGSSVPVPINEPVAITMPPLGQSLDITVPVAFSSGRIYFSQGALEFSIVGIGGGNEGLVQPSVNNLQDPSRNLNWGFVELTLTTTGEIWANISYVDFIGIIMSMTLRNTDGSIDEVVGLPGDGVRRVCEALKAQGDRDGRPWAAMCIADEAGNPLRVLSPEDYETVGPGGFDDYFDAYVDEVWDLYRAQPLTVDTQNDALGNAGNVVCQVQGEELQCEGDNRGYAKPTVHDIWGCNSGPFGIQEGDNAVHYAVVPRLCAAFQRATYTIPGGDHQPGVGADQYYTVDPASHYSRIVHENEVDGKGYAFPYDDVNPDGAPDAAGLVTSGNHDVLVFYVGGAQSS